MLTKKNACPFSQRIRVVEIPATDPNNATGAPVREPRVEMAPCLGTRCQLWMFDGAGNPEDGNCSLTVTGAMTAHIAQRTEDAFVAIRQSQVEADKMMADVAQARVRFAELLAAAEKLTTQLVQLNKK